MRDVGADWIDSKCTPSWFNPARCTDMEERSKRFLEVVGKMADSTMVFRGRVDKGADSSGFFEVGLKKC